MALKVSFIGGKLMLSHINPETAGEREIGRKTGRGRETLAV